LIIHCDFSETSGVNRNRPTQFLLNNQQ